MPRQSYYDEVEIEDFKWDPEKKVFHYPCPCGDRFEITKGQLRDGDDVATCPSCSLLLRVVYEWDDYADYDSDEEGEAAAPPAEEVLATPPQRPIAADADDVQIAEPDATPSLSSAADVPTEKADGQGDNRSAGRSAGRSSSNDGAEGEAGTSGTSRNTTNTQEVEDALDRVKLDDDKDPS